MKKLLWRTAQRYGLHVSKATDRAALARLIERLHPVQTERQLRRIGGDGDGGYLIPDDLVGLSACYSPGIGPTSAFEVHLAELGIRSHLADYSVAQIDPRLDPLSFTRKYVGVAASADTIPFERWVLGSQADEAGDLLLQMDIEGAEYPVLMNTGIDLLSRFRIMAIEFHALERWSDPAFFRLVDAMFTKLLSLFHVVHIHPNNCCGTSNLSGLVVPNVAEMTFLRKDRSPRTGYCRQFPHALDQANRPGDELVLPPTWYRQTDDAVR